MGVLECLALLMAEDLGGHEADHARDPVTVQAQLRKARIVVVIEVHLHAVDDLLEVFLGERVAPARDLERPADRMPRLATEDAPDLVPPPVEPGPRDTGIARLVDRVVDLATEGIEGRDRLPLFGRQEQEAVVETRAAPRGLLLAILVGGHVTIGEPAAGDGWRRL